LKKSLSHNGYNLPENYLTESELEDKLWELL
ncbi:energy-coupling factor transporter ATPase, partial [Klebsiella pneumoniae]|nr:energy-coupling factor transporter ATPase [Klebsiella pneumoniae]